MTNRVNIRPGVSVLSVLRHLNYKPWFAMAEFVDNALQSFLACQTTLADLGQTSVTVKITLDERDGGLITIRDDAGGIKLEDFPRAFRPAAIPADRSGLSEFGMGMKSAACWFSPEWSVRTTAIGEGVERLVQLDVNSIVSNQVEDLPVWESSVKPSTHYTEIQLLRPHKLPFGRTIAKIKDHLASIYRLFIRAGKLRLILNDELLVYEMPTILEAPFYKQPKADSVRWLKEIEFELNGGKKVLGFVALRETGSTSRAGLALFRRGRLIEGSADEPYRPEYIFGKANSYTFQRLFGELHLTGFDVSHTKDGFRWEDDEDAFLAELKRQIDREPLRLIAQAEGFRARQPRERILDAANDAVTKTSAVLAANAAASLVETVAAPAAPEPPPVLDAHAPLADRDFQLELKDQSWRIKLELVNDPAVVEWVAIADAPRTARGDAPRTLTVRLSIAHPFMERFMGADYTSLEPLLRVAAALALSEIAARDSGVRGAGTVRRNVNHILRFALSKP
jgi:hypothetical protein